jgi:hypothetical protein
MFLALIILSAPEISISFFLEEFFFFWLFYLAQIQNRGKLTDQIAKGPLPSDISILFRAIL